MYLMSHFKNITINHCYTWMDYKCVCDLNTDKITYFIHILSAFLVKICEDRFSVCWFS